MVVTVQQRRWVCMNPDCSERRNYERPRVLVVGDLAPGTDLDLYCPKCHWHTRVRVDGGGQVEYRLVQNGTARR